MTDLISTQHYLLEVKVSARLVFQFHFTKAGAGILQGDIFIAASILQLQTLELESRSAVC